MSLYAPDIDAFEKRYRENQPQVVWTKLVADLETPVSAMLKLASCEMQCDVADQCLQLFGGYGYTTEYPISRFYVDARIQTIYGGTSEIMRELVARSILGRE